MDDNGRRTGTGQTIKGVVVTGGSLPFAARASSPSTIKHQIFQCYRMVLPDRIELSTSPLPMECSTTELRQRARITGVGQIGPTRRPILATRPLLAQARGLRCADRGGAAAACFDRAMGWPIRFPRLAARRRRLDRADHDL